MQDDGSLPPLMPDDFAALAALAGPLYQESRTIEAYTSNNPIPNTHDNYGSMNIMQGLEQAKRLAQASVVHPTATYVTPAPVEYIPVIPSITPSPVSDNQMELNFNSNELSITNELLREISRKMSRIISLIEIKDKEDSIPKLKSNVKN
jgi:hypothetical protein